MIPTATADWPIDGYIIHPIQKKLTVSGWDEIDFIDQISQSVLNVCLPHIPFFQENYLNRVLTALADRNFLFSLDDIAHFAIRFENLQRLFTGLAHRHPYKWTCNFGHTTI